MKTFPLYLVFATAGIVMGFQAALAQGYHFRPVAIPAGEVRLMELARIREFRSSYEMGEFCQGTLLIAELHDDGKAVKSFLLSRAKHDTAKQGRSGLLSLGWHRDLHQLVSLNDDGDLHGPWVAKIDLPDFKPFDACYFQNSLPEEREPARGGGLKFKLYPVVGLCGDRTAQIDYSEVKTREDFLKACKAAGAKNMLMIYLYPSPFDEQPSVEFQNQN